MAMEILTQSSTIEELNTKKQGLQSENVSLQNKDSSQDIIALRNKEEEQKKIEEDKNALDVSDMTRLESLKSEKQNKATLYDGQLKDLDFDHARDKEVQKNKYQQEMMKANEEFKQLQIQKDEAAKQFKQDIEQLIRDQTPEIAQKDREHSQQMQAVEEEIDKLNKDIDRLKQKHDQIVELIECDA